MDLSKLEDELGKRGKSCLHNGDEITPQALERATSETIDYIGKRKVRDFAIMDFAFTRLKIYLKISLSEEDELLYKAAIKEIESSPVVDDETGEKKYSFIAIEKGESVWEN